MAGYGHDVPPIPVRVTSVKADKNGASHDGKKKRWFKGGGGSNPGKRGTVVGTSLYRTPVSTSEVRCLRFHCGPHSHNILVSYLRGKVQSLG